MTDPVENFIRSAEDLTASIENMNEDDRARVLQKLYETTTKVESPWDTFPATIAALKVLNDLRLLEKWQAKGNVAMSEIELAELAGGSCDAALLREQLIVFLARREELTGTDRLLRLLASNNLVDMMPDGKFKPDKFCVRLADTDFGTTAHFYFDYMVPTLSHMPKYLAKTHYLNPRNGRKTMFDSAFGYEGGLFKYLQENPEKGQAFNILQKTSTSSHTRWTEIFPPHILLDSDPTLPLLVDVGGSIGQDIQAFYEKHPETASRLYLEDIPSVIADENSSVVKGINKLTYNFFKPQPIKHARAYYMHHILHDWPDQTVLKILEMQKSAMKPGYSKLLIHDHIIDDDKPPHPHAAGYDILMMVLGSAQERTEKQWRSLMDAAGLRIVKIWRTASAVQGVIEVELPVKGSHL
ncbi:hypothetical protein CkaCkLH20_12551 [Colletotrichum karsti]|uniref:O-methyltransferase C-terminal domain-containing protein n=1 Tax=Colletotrichum karsti TaxID=1095194 RepID=A0A9P6LF48_9PEZI|nr:uncharacterized protein CkaCkLH20_12551 [Colletotrichum karsti]KAF9869942.1 hypothetical protein CkaCkLH20_12551 [Colletotrichum karsti]